MELLPNNRIASDWHAVLTLKDNGIAVDWSTCEALSVFMLAEAQGYAFAGACEAEIDAQDPKRLHIVWPASVQMYEGAHRIAVQVSIAGDVKTYDKRAVVVVPLSDSAAVVYDTDETQIELEVAEVDTSVLTAILRACQQATYEAQEGEKSREEGETLREAAETERTAAEVARKANEAERVKAEDERNSSEQVRKAAEGSRVDAEQQRAEAEQARKAAEVERVAAELDRANAEKQRQAAEQQRQTAETLREQEFRTAEERRQTAEVGRVQAEQQRQAAEELRAENEVQRQEAAEATKAATVAANKAASAALDAKASVEQMSLGLAAIVLEDGELKLAQNAESGTAISGRITEEGVVQIDFEI